MSSNSRQELIERISRSQERRANFVESHLNKTVAFQVRATRDRLGWTQEQLADKIGISQNAISRLESPEYGKATLTTLKRLAAALDVALVVRMVPFSQFVDWVSGTPYLDHGLDPEALAVVPFSEEKVHLVATKQLDTPLTTVLQSQYTGLREEAEQKLVVTRSAPLRTRGRRGGHRTVRIQPARQSPTTDYARLA